MQEERVRTLMGEACEALEIWILTECGEQESDTSTGQQPVADVQRPRIMDMPLTPGGSTQALATRPHGLP